MIATGNFPGKYFGLMSETGYTIALKRTNAFELAAQFTAVCKFPVPHYLKDARDFYPESWGMSFYYIWMFSIQIKYSFFSPEAK